MDANGAWNTNPMSGYNGSGPAFCALWASVSGYGDIVIACNARTDNPSGSWSMPSIPNLPTANPNGVAGFFYTDSTTRMWQFELYGSYTLTIQGGTSVYIASGNSSRPNPYNSSEYFVINASWV